MIHSKTTGLIIKACHEVHRFLGNGFEEVIYQRALCHELREQGLSFEREKELLIFYKHLKEPLGSQRVDFVVASLVLIEVKSVRELNDAHVAQTLNYLKAFRIEVGLLVNFGAPSLEFKRLIMTQP